MADTNVSLGFKASEFNAEIKKMSAELKSTQRDFKLLDATLQSSGTKLQQLENKQKTYGKQLELQQQITKKYEQAVKQAADAQEKARARLEKANQAYENGKKELKGNSEELKKLKDEVTKSEKAVNTATNQYEKYNNKLKDSKTAEINMQVALKNTSKALENQKKYITQVKDKYSELQKKTETVRSGLNKAGSALTKGVTVPILAGAAASASAFKAVENGTNIVIKKTGATGKAAEALKNNFKNVAAESISSFEDIGSAVGEINTRFDFTGKKLELASQQFLKFAKINDIDVTTAVSLVSRAMKDASIDADNYSDVLDMLTVASQKSGISIDNLATNLAKYGAPLRALGFDVKTSIATFAAWEKAGVNTEIAFSGLKKSISNWGKAGKDSTKEFSKAMEEIKKAPTLAKATTKAIEVFGAKAGPDLADAIRGGRFEVTEYMKALEECGGAVTKTADEIGNDAAKQLEKAKHNIELAASDMWETVVVSAEPVIEDLCDITKRGAQKIDEMSESQRRNTIKWIAVSAGAGATLLVLEKGINVFNAIKAVATTLGGALSATAGAFTALAPAVGVAALAFSPLLVGMGLAQYDAKKTREEMLHFGDAVSSAFSELDKADKKKNSTEKLIKEYEALRKKINSNKLSTDELSTAKKELERVQDELIKQNPDVLSTYDKENGRMDDEIKKLKEKNQLAYENAKLKAKNAAQEAENKLPEQISRLESTQRKADEYKNQIALAEKSYNTLLKLQNQYTEIVNNSALTTQKKSVKLNDILKQANDAGHYVGVNVNNVQNLAKATATAQEHIKTLRTDAINCNNDLEAAYKTTQSTYNNIKKSIEFDLGSTFEKATNDLAWYNNQMKELEKNGKTSTPEYKELKKAFEQLKPKVETAGSAIASLNGKFKDMPNVKKVDVEALTEKTNVKLNITKKNVDKIPNKKNIKVDADTTQADTKLTEMAQKLLGLTKAPYKVKTVEETVLKTTYENGGLPKISGHANGTNNADPGLSVVNEKGTELIEKKDGSFYMASGSPALVNLQAGDKVYTAEETRKMYSELPHFADGKSAYESAKEAFAHRKATSEVSLTDQIAWWRNVLAQFGADADAVKEAQEEIYSLTQELAEKQKEDYKTNLDEQLELSKKYIDNCLYSAEWGSDSLEKAFNRVKNRYDKALKDGKITIDEYKSAISDISDTIYNNAVEYSENWLENMSKYGYIDDNQYIQGLQRIADNVKSMYEQGIIDYRQYVEKTNSIAGEMYDKRLSLAQSYLDDYYDKRTKEVNNYYDSLDEAETKETRSKNLSDLQAQEAIYANAATKAGREKLQSIRDQIAEIKKEEEKEQREKEKQAKLDAIESEKSTTLAGINKYIADISTAYGSANNESAKMFDELMKNYTAQQTEIAATGYKNVRNYIAAARAEMVKFLQDIGDYIGGNTNITNTTEINNTQQQTIYNQVNDITEAEMFGNSAARAFRRYANPHLYR